ncbi:MAG: phosphoribosyltransferase [Candidatus Caldarchaeum sp.]|uniref:Phosphoribosyltransferase n=1 Tax=Caldiarchaeum subterraneum TaxID=311458 RepID=A0A7C5LD91_CALS0
MLFHDRVDAGRRLAKQLKKKVRGDCIVLAVPRGGVVVGFEVARELNCPLDVVISRKIGAPGQPELAVGALAEDGTVFVDEEIANVVGVSEEYVRRKAGEEDREVKRRAEAYRGGRPMPDLRGKTVVLVDDGLATGLTMKAAVHMARNSGAEKVIVAVPVSPPETVEKLNKLADEVVCLETPSEFYAIGQFYDRFEQLSDEEVKEILRKSRAMV